MIAMIYANLLDSLISMKRIEKFLEQDDIIEENLIKNDEESINNGFDIVIKNCDFSWGMGKKAEKNAEKTGGAAGAATRSAARAARSTAPAAGAAARSAARAACTTV